MKGRVDRQNQVEKSMNACLRDKKHGNEVT